MTTDDMKKRTYVPEKAIIPVVKRPPNFNSQEQIKTMSIKSFTYNKMISFPYSDNVQTPHQHMIRKMHFHISTFVFDEVLKFCIN